MLERLAVNLGRKDELLNIELAEYLVEKEDSNGISEIVQGLMQKKAIANDCIKVLYEIGERNPVLIADYVSEFISLLTSSNNRLVWGAMTALNQISDLKAEIIFSQIDKVIYAYKNGSVITIDHSISVFSKLCKADKKYQEELFPLLINHLNTCRIKEIPQHAERISICVNPTNKDRFIESLEKRKYLLSKSQLKRVEKLIKKIK